MAANTTLDGTIRQEQEKTFGIQSFIQNSKQYAGDFFNEIDNRTNIKFCNFRKC